MNEKLTNYLIQRYKYSCDDLFSVFIERNLQFANNTGLVSMITQHTWMFASDYEDLRKKLIHNCLFINMAHQGTHGFDEIGGEIVQTIAFVFMKGYIKGYIGCYARLLQGRNESEKELLFLKQKNLFNANQDLFYKVPRTPIAYWVSEKARNTFENKLLKETMNPKQGTSTGADEIFVRYWFEISRIEFSNKQTSLTEALNSDFVYFPLNKGGEFRRWYGINERVIKMNNDAYNKLLKLGNHLPSRDLYFKPGITWSKICGDRPSFRLDNYGFVFSSVGLKAFPTKKETKYTLGYLNTKLINYYLAIISPGLSTVSGDIEKIPIIFNEKKGKIIEDLVEQNISLSKSDWDSFETSWDFSKHPLLPVNIDYKEAAVNSILISGCYSKWEKECSERFATLKSNEEELNRIFIEIYGLQDELTPDVQDKDVTVRLADRTRDIKSFTSYAVGCMFGRYSLSKEGLAYAGGDMDMNNYKYFIPDADNVIPVTDEEYFSDDIVTRFVEFVRQVYGESTLEENLRFIAESLPNKGDTPKEVIRSYFLNDFYKDHCKTYQKRPIY